MRKVFSVLMALALVTGVQFFSTDAQAKKCGCVKAFNKCYKKAKKSTNKPKPGEAVKNLKERKKKFRACDTAFNKCSRKCGAKCVSECRAKKKVMKKSCREDFKDTLCPVKGKNHRTCKKDAKKARNECIKDAKDDNCKKMCK